jgi:hypothetical protein
MVIYCHEKKNSPEKLITTNYCHEKKISPEN